MSAPDKAEPVAVRYRPKGDAAEPWRYTDDNHASVLGVLGERIGLFDIEPLHPESALLAERQAREAAERERDEARNGWKQASELLDAAVGDYNAEHDRFEAAEASLAKAEAGLAERPSGIGQ